jgi:hypothetical protein
MIPEIETEEEIKNYPIILDLGRPDIWDATSRKLWKDIHNQIKKGSIEMLVNSVFWRIDDIIEDEKHPGYMGGGFKYQFWFKNEEDKHSFQTIVRNL